VLYVTERAVFRLAEGGVEVLEIAPGCDLERDVLAEMGFRPEISPALRQMSPSIFRPGLLALRRSWSAQPGDRPS
jgi:propionate CoA-transferase